MQQQKHFFLFLALTFLLFIGWINLRQRLWPPPPPPEVPPVANKAPKEEKKPPVVEAPPIKVAPLPITKTDDLLSLGSKERDSKYHLGVVLDPKGAGVRSIVLNKFQQAKENGKPDWQDEEKKIPKPLELVPDWLNRELPSSLLYHFDVNDSVDEMPLDTLGRIPWNVLGEKSHLVSEETLDDGRQLQRVRFQATVQGVTITKTYTLTEGEYHLGLEVKLKADKSVKFRYQLTGSHGLPVEGLWYTSTFRNALTAQVENRSVFRDLQTLQQISLWGGGNEVRKQEHRLLRYAGVAVQFFASVIVVDNTQKIQDFLSKARPTLETAVARGKVKSVAADRSTFTLTLSEKLEQTFQVLPRDRAMLADLRPDMRIGVVHRSAPFDETTMTYPEIATEISFNPDAMHPVWVDDITVRVATELIDLKPDVEVTHKYLLYNGPIKVQLLGQMSGDAAVPPELVDRYVNDLSLNTLTDYHSPGFMGTFASSIYWTDTLIFFTNLMHKVLFLLHSVVWSYGLCIILLTVMVRGLMFPVSRKQAMTALRMQELAPELKKLQEKYKDDRQAMGMAQMELYRKHGVNPFGTCWLILLQMPVFMGLYYALQESIHFRLAPFWPTWIDNLAAPDMLFWWTESIPILSRPQDFGGILYLGPYFNLLPVIAVTLMIFQQRMMTPPPVDEQQRMQQSMMKYMMVFFGLMFYKVAAGLCIYFIASSVWGFCERKLLPKRKLDPAAPAKEGLLSKWLRPNSAAVTTSPTGTLAVNEPRSSSTAITTTASDGSNRIKKKPGRNKRRPERGRSEGRPTPAGADNTSLLQRLRDWWQDLLEQAQKK
jgi:YidC/Oxa1 family membrane protein insertase